MERKIIIIMPTYIRLNHVVAFEILGKCQCTAGYKGRDCEVPCERGRYGIGCAYRCDCEHANSEGCDHVTGKCICNSGWRGKKYRTILIYNVSVQISQPVQ